MIKGNGGVGEHGVHVGECALAFRKLTLVQHCRCQCSGDCVDCIHSVLGRVSLGLELWARRCRAVHILASVFFLTANGLASVFV